MQFFTYIIKEHHQLKENVICLLQEVLSIWAYASSENNTNIRPTKRNLQVLTTAVPFSQQMGQWRPILQKHKLK